MTDMPQPEGLQISQLLAAGAVSAGFHLAPVDGDADAVISQQQARIAADHLGFSGTGQTVVVMVDGLGLSMLEERRGHAPTLRRWLSSTQMTRPGGWAEAGTTCVPSTTAAAITSLGTGALPAVTGMVGYTAVAPWLARPLPAEHRPRMEDLLCLITWADSQVPPEQWQDIPTIGERLGGEAALAAGDHPAWVSVGLSRFAGSGLTQAALRGAEHRGVDAMEERPRAVLAALRQGVPLVYLYVGELDHTGHHYGWTSPQWTQQLERLDAALAELERRAPAGTRILVTADHGMIDVRDEDRCQLRRFPELAASVAAIGGEPRFLHLYVGQGSDPQEVADLWRTTLGERAAAVLTHEEAGQLMGAPAAGMSERVSRVVGDVVVAMNDRWVLTDARVHSPGARALIGVHGSITEDERRIPVLRTIV